LPEAKVLPEVQLNTCSPQLNRFLRRLLGVGTAADSVSVSQMEKYFPFFLIVARGIE
jgi:hypothetical protein